MKTKLNNFLTKELGMLLEIEKNKWFELIINWISLVWYLNETSQAEQQEADKSSLNISTLNLYDFCAGGLWEIRHFKIHNLIILKLLSTSDQLVAHHIFLMHQYSALIE